MLLTPKPKQVDYKQDFIKTKTFFIAKNDFEELYYHIDNNFKLDKKGMPCFIILDNLLSEEAYKLTLDEKIVIHSSTSKGAYYALMTLKQILVNDEIPCLEIYDEPDLKVRGIMIDISRSKVPTIDTLKQMIEYFSSLKYNHLELYVEGFSFEYKSIPAANMVKNYITQEEFIQIRDYCNKYFIDFVPNQNGFGHMTDWLSTKEYEDLAEIKEGFTIWGCKRPPSTLDPTNPKSLELVYKLYDEMLPLSNSTYFNMNFDEPYELGHGNSKEICEKTSIEDAYIDYFNKVSSYFKKYNVTPMIWGDVLVKHPEKIQKLSKDTIFIDWGYNKDYPFEKHSTMLESLNVSYLLAPGTSSWGCITGRFIDMEETIKNSCLSAKKHKGGGVILTDWGDMGHLQYLVSSKLAFIYASMLMWSNSDISEAICFLEKELGPELTNVVVELSKYHMLEGEYRDYGSRLFSLIMWAEHATRQSDKVQFFLEKMKSNMIDKINVSQLKELFEKNKQTLLKVNESLEKEEISNSLYLLETLLDISELLNDYFNKCIVNFEKSIKKLEIYNNNHKKLWMARNKEEGYMSSSSRITNLIEMLMLLDGKEQI